MIKYSYKDKELKVPTGVGNNNNEGFEEGYDLGYEEGIEVSFPTGYASGWTDGHVSGVTDGVAEQKAKLESATFSGSGVYTKEDGWNQVTVEVNNLVSGDVDMKSIHQTFGKNDLRPEGPNGEIVYGGDFEEFQNLIIEEGGVFQIKKWNNEEHTEYTLQLIMHPNEWAIFEDQIVFRPWSDIPSEWTNLFNDLYARYDGTSIYFYWNYPYDGFFTDARDNILPDEVMYLDLGYDGISAITVNAENIFASGHTSGNTDGFNIGYPSGHTDGYNEAFPIAWNEGHQSGYTDGYNRRNSMKAINFFSLALGLNYGDSGVTMENIDYITWGDAFAFYSDGTYWPVVEDINTSIQYDSAGTKMILFEGDSLNGAGFGELLEPSIDFHFHESVSNFQVKWLWVNYYVYKGQMMGGLKVNLYNSPQSGKDIEKTLF